MSKKASTAADKIASTATQADSADQQTGQSVDAAAGDAGQADEGSATAGDESGSADVAAGSGSTGVLIAARSEDLVRQIAQVCHEANHAYSASIGDHSHLPWELASEETKASIISGVEKHLANPDMTPADSHAAWLEFKGAQGYSYGPVRDEAKKLHPCMLAYEDLPQAQRSKDYIFRAVVHATAKALGAA